MRCADGAVGELADLVIDPGRRCVTHLVVQPDERAGFDSARLVPVALASSPGEEPGIALGCTIEELGRLETVQEFAYLRLESFPVDDPDWDVGISAVLATPYYGPAELSELNYAPDAGMVYDRIPKGEVEIRRASPVSSADGHHLGHVEAFIVDDRDQVTHFVLERGHLWGRREVTIPIGAVERIETDMVTVALTREEVGELPSVRVRRW